ncbi:MADS-box transcription factor 14-like [Phalaenopsis equestris]|uniref:MADS-box transcription factor 14-like n=1 Tax=Phalaenopsis equestris TaxID=78828 RepID=UPI0009E47CD7|nr:MADS-box transcription factor 14-like [Phalaenopsis equestris]
MPRSMGKGSVQVTFSKRRAGLMKKAHEISVLCNASVALVIFSSKGALYEYSTDSNMQRILERYEQCIYAEKALPPKEPLSQEELYGEYRELKRKVDAMQRSQSHAMGENLDTLSVIELQQLEIRLETALKRIKSQMNQILLDSIAEFQRKARFSLICLLNQIPEKHY